jgi:hypothetical protein
MQVSERPVTDVFSECKSKVTRTTYPKTLKKFFEYLVRKGLLQGCKENDDVDTQGKVFLAQARQDPEYANQKIKDYIFKNRERVEAGEITAGTLKGLFTPIKTFCDGFDDITAKVNWKRIKKGMPTVQHYSDDRAPTREEIIKICEFPDRRIKAIVYTMASSGIRIGAWETMKWKHVEPIRNDKGEIIAARLQVYAKESGNYRTFITPEAYNELQKYMDFRAMYGEEITRESWVIRNNFKTSDMKRNTPAENGGGINGRAEKPRQLTVAALNRLLVRALYEQGLRESLEEGEKRHQWKAGHGYRKWFKTTAEHAGMKTLYVELLMGHTIGLEANYLRMTEQDKIDEYLKIVPALTFTENVQSLKQQQEVLAKKQEDKDAEIAELREANKIAMETMAEFQTKMEQVTKKLDDTDAALREVNEIHAKTSNELLTTDTILKEISEKEEDADNKHQLIMLLEAAVKEIARLKQQPNPLEQQNKKNLRKQKSYK